MTITHQDIAERVAEIYGECETVKLLERSLFLSNKAHARARAELQSLQELCGGGIGHDFTKWRTVYWVRFVPEPATSGIGRARYCRVCEFEEREPVVPAAVTDAEATHG